MKNIIFHSATSEDQAAMAALRKMVEPNKGRPRGAAARGPFDEIMGRVIAPNGVTYKEDIVGGVPGWWCTPADDQPAGVICHFHGGWFNFGSAKAFRHFVGHIAAKANVAAFVPDYRLAPEHPFPAALDDADSCYRGLLDLGYTRIALTGDSAGGNLALVLLSRLQQDTKTIKPTAAVALSPVTDLALSGDTWSSRAEVDPYFTRSQATELVSAYVGAHDPKDPLVSPLYGYLASLPPIRVHVGNDEVLLDDTLRYVQRAVDSGVDATADVWECMTHGFLSGVGKLDAANKALEAIGSFLAIRLAVSK